MRFISFVVVSLLGLTAQAQLDLAQSSPEVKWRSISNAAVQVIYPDYLQVDSLYIANLVEHYSHVVGQTYGIEKPRSFDLIIRPEMAQPNGYVTLMPRRSEWFTSSTFFPGLGGAEWYQSLSIHEYRHVNQFDFFKRRGTNAFYIFMGEMGQQVAIFLSLPSWYFEGDAVWAETKYTDAGRGRSPRFIARLKALVLSDNIPTYDQFLNGTYKTSLPNQYVYGYALISYATKKYGEDVWMKVIDDVSVFPNPFRLYSSFERVTKQSFRDFYNEAMNDLRTQWLKDAPKDEAKVDYRDNSAPYKVGSTLYYINQTLNTYPTVYKEEDGKREKIAELPYNREFLKFYAGTDKAVYTEFLPDKRYQQRSFSDLMILDLKTGKKEKLSHQQRIYNPTLNESQTKIIATDFRPEQTWNISEFDLQGNLLQTFKLEEGKVAEVQYVDDQHAVAIVNSKIGLKSLVVVDLKEKKVSKVLVPPSRNILSNLYIDKKKNLLFEAQYKGSNDIFKINQDGLTRCSESRLGAFTPSSDGTNLYYSDMDTYGSQIATRSLASCTALPAGELVDFKYLGNSPSDNYNGFPIQSFDDQEQMFTKNADKYTSQPYGDLDSRFWIPHTWGINLGRGGGLGVRTDNYLRTMGLSAVLGVDAEEQKPFAALSFDYKKYYPLFSFQVENRERSVTEYNSNDKQGWTELSPGLLMTLPLIKKRGFYNFVSTLSLGGSYVSATDYTFNDVDLSGSNELYKTTSALTLSWGKDLTARSIISPWLASYLIRYDDAEASTNSALSSYRVYQQAAVQTPGLFRNNGMRFTYDHQRQDESSTGYRFLPEAVGPGAYTFSRGYTYKDVAEYQKLSANYLFPIAYPDWTIEKWLYVKRLYSTLFFDSTVVETSPVSSTTLNSYGLELLFETKVLRILPLTLGGRVLQRLTDDKVKGEFFLATGLQL